MISRVKTETTIREGLGITGTLAADLEEAIYVQSSLLAERGGGEQAHIYRAKVHRILANLSRSSTINNGTVPPVYTDYVSGNITATQLVAMDNFTIHSASADLQRTLELRKNSIVKESYSTEFTCSRCKSNKAREYRDQTRSGDEGYTYKVECMTCGNKWSPN